MSQLIQTSLLALTLSLGLTAQAAQVLHEVSSSPRQATITFVDQQIKSYSAEELKTRQITVQKMIDKDSKLYDRLIEKMVILKSSKPANLISTGVDNGLLGSMFEAYANHIPLTLRPDDVWLGITTAFAHYVNKNAEQMRKHFVTHEGKTELVVRMSGSLAMSDEAFWTEFTRRMLALMQQFTTADLREWLVPSFSTTTPKDQLVGQIVMMGAMKEYFDYAGVLSSALTKLTLKGTLEDWQNLRSRAEKIGNYGGVLKEWSELLLPVLDQFVEAYKGNVNEDFWQRMITYRRLGSGGQKQFRGWFLVFAPFNADGKYHLNSKTIIDKTGIYATLDDNKIYHAVVDVPVKLNDNGTLHDLVFWGGVTAPKYSAKRNVIAPSVDWAIVDKVKLPKQEILQKIVEIYSYSKYSDLKPTYKELVTEAEFNEAVSNYNEEKAARRKQLEAQNEARQKEELAALLKLPKSELLKKVAEKYYYFGYEKLRQELQAVITPPEFQQAVADYKVRVEEEEKARQQKEKARLLALPKAELLKHFAMFGASESIYDQLDPEFKKRFTRQEFMEAAEARKKVLEAANAWH